MNPWADEERQWRDTSIYHQELLCEFGLYELFRRRGTLREANVRSGVFSTSTRMGKNLRESEKLSLEPEFGGTIFDNSSLDDLFKGRGSLVYTISDGEIENWETIYKTDSHGKMEKDKDGNPIVLGQGVKERFIEGAKKHNYFHL